MLAPMAGASAYVVVVSPHVVSATPCTVKPEVELSVAYIRSVAAVTVSPAGTETANRRYVVVVGEPSARSAEAFPKFEVRRLACT
jgi:hypothetical protein